MNTNPPTLGRVLNLWRYPVKSMLGESCLSLEVNDRGIKGDRIFAIRDRQGKFGNGQRILRNHPDIHRMLSKTLGQSVTLSVEEQISHLDAGPIHLITTAALRSLQQRCPMATIDTRRFRPKVLQAILRMRGFANDRNITRRFGRHFGVYAKAIVPGIIFKGDVVTIG